VFKDVPPHLVRLASSCLAQLETSGDLLSATERACAQLEHHLTAQLGSTRAQALLVLALALARADVPVPGELTATPDGRLPPLHSVLEKRPQAEVRAALVALLAHTLGLLATLAGEAAADQAAQAVVAAAAHPKRCTRPI
jgi:hypothetical protein